MKSKSSCKTKLNIPSNYLEELKKYPKTSRFAWTKEKEDFVILAKNEGYTYETIGKILGTTLTVVRARHRKIINTF